MRQKTFLILFFFFYLFSLSGQQAVIPEKEKQISELFDSLKISVDDEEKERINDKIIKLFSEELQNPESFSNSYSSLSFVGKIFSDDNKVKLYTWCYPLSDKTYGYGGFIQYKTKKTTETIPLTIKNEAYLPLNNKRIPVTDWYGALYYKIVPVKHKKENYYVLLGWAGNNAVSDFKLIDVLNFDGKNIYFGKPVFKQKHKTLQRFVLEYNADAMTSLSFDPKSKKIIFDHLVPPEPVYTNVYSYYGPDFTYDAFVLKKGIWFFEENVDAKNEE